ncbi:hypothetical protein vseg_006445 [Gypsophila vaccaria]
MRVFSKFSYQKLTKEVIFQDDNEAITPRPFPTKGSRYTRIRPRRLRLRIGGFRKLFRMKRVRVGGLTWAKFVKRFKESQAHFGDLFSGNYLFMQVSPSSISNNKAYLASHSLNHNYNINYHVNDDKFHGFGSSRFNNYALEKVA